METLRMRLLLRSAKTPLACLCESMAQPEGRLPCYLKRLRVICKSRRFRQKLPVIS